MVKMTCCYLVWIKSSHSLRESFLSSEEVGPGQDDGSIKLTNSHIKDAVSNKTVFLLVASIPEQET